MWYSCFYYSLTGACFPAPISCGLLGQLISDPDLADRVRAAVTHFDELMVAFREGEGLIPQLMSDPVMASDLRETLAAVRDISEKINTGTGSLAMMVNDDQLYRELLTTLKTLQDLTEDAREQAPINAFLSPVFQAAF